MLRCESGYIKAMRNDGGFLSTAPKKSKDSKPRTLFKINTVY